MPGAVGRATFEGKDGNRECVFGFLQAPATGMFGDELIKNFLMDYATENFEIACYEALVTAADQVGEPEIAAVCREILQEEQQMADWIRNNLPSVVAEYTRTPVAR